ncbi:hypothetical protein V491_01908 [Pseudogymnoascus sp. VKM F-3775]|nr:hypothetical protein V491_01908 [Pseudogymnoascus sp. VKM F-3775]
MNVLWVTLKLGFDEKVELSSIDYTHDYALELIEQLTGDRSKAETIKKSRVQMLNIWKPLRGPLRSWPLALCDLRSLSREDIITFDEVHSTAVLESQQVIYNPSQKWYYLSNQEPNELIVFKSMDTVVRGEVAHGSFYDPNCPENEPPRESIELRVLVVY